MGSKFFKYFKNAASLFISIALSIVFFFLILRSESINNFFGDLLDILMPVIYGAVIAYILRPICNFFECKFTYIIKKFTNNKVILSCIEPFSVTLSVILGIVALYLFLSMVIPQLFESISLIVTSAPENLKSFQNIINKFLTSDDTLQKYLNDLTEYGNQALSNWLSNDLMPSMKVLIDGISSSVLGVATTLYNLFFGIVFAIYILLDRKKLFAQAKMIFSIFSKLKIYNFVIEEIKFADRAFSNFINGKLISSIIVGFVCFIFTVIADIPYGVLISVVIGVTNMIPFFGAFLGNIPAFLLVVIINPPKAFMLLIFLMIIQQLDSNILTPKILGNSIGLPGLWILFSIVLFGGLFGFVGMIIGIPTFAVIYDIIKKVISAKLKKNDNEIYLIEYNKKYHSDIEFTETNNSEIKTEKAEVIQNQK